MSSRRCLGLRPSAGYRRRRAAAWATSRLPGGHVIDLSGELTDFAETAAVIRNLDLVVPVETEMAHLAGRAIHTN
jgi:hypothetical protein